MKILAIVGIYEYVSVSILCVNTKQLYHRLLQCVWLE
jgi:hypothetical protein